jgi:hypothetical protein
MAEKGLSMQASNYAEWCRLSGLYLANLSHVDRYRTYAKVLSPAGLTVAIVSEFLEDANPAMDVNDWRSYRVYEFGDEQRERIERTVEALKEVGAVRLAEAVATARSQSPFDLIQNLMSGGSSDLESVMKAMNPLDLLQSLQKSLPGSQASSDLDSPLDAAPLSRESRPELEALLERFAQAHAEELQRDLQRHGDPRHAPGFTLAKRMKELDALRDRWISHQTQAEAIETLTKVMSKLPKLVDQKTPGKEKKAASHQKQLVRQFREKAKELRKTPEVDRSPETIAFLPQMEEFESRQAALLRPDAIGDEAIRQRAEAIGPVETETNRKETVLSWEHAQRIDCDWAEFTLTLSVPAKSKEALNAGLHAVEQLQRQFGELEQDWRRQVLQSFRENYQGQLDDEYLADYDLDEQGEPTDSAILERVASGSIHLSADSSANFSPVVYLNVEWDQEHGMELEVDIDLNPSEAVPTDSVDLGNITFDQAGPAVTEESLKQLESAFEVALPSLYRDFLMQVNGGVPSKTHLVLRTEGDESHWNITRFLSVSGATAEPLPPGSLESYFRPANSLRIHSHLLPIARVHQGTFPPRPIGDPILAIVLKGTRAGRIVFFEAEMPLPEMGMESKDSLLQMMLEEAVRSAPVVAPNLSSLFGKLQLPPKVEIPIWLKAIREDRVDDFLAWLDHGGKWKETFIEPGSHFQPRVIDLLAAEATPEFLQTLLQKKKLTPKQLREPWRNYLILDIPRSQQLMKAVPPSEWSLVLASPCVWGYPALLEQLATAKVDVNAVMDDEGATPLHLAVQMGREEAVRWLMEQGADPHQKDRYSRDAFIYAEHGPGFNCLALLKGENKPVATGKATPDAPGINELAEAAAQFAPGRTLLLQIEMKSPPVTRIEKVYYPDTGCHYRLTFEVGKGQVTFNDTRSPRQDYLHAPTWIEALFLPILQWPELSPLWETLQVSEFELAQAMKSRKYTPMPRPELVPAARSALEQGFNAEEAAARGVQLRK